MHKKQSYDVLIIGGGLAGLTAALHLSKTIHNICIVEKETYPNHKVCGEYVSNEVIPYLTYLGIDINQLNTASISNFELITSKGNSLKIKLPLGGFGISRYKFDNALYIKAKKNTTFVYDTVVATQITDTGGKVTLKSGKDLFAKIIIGAYGKRSLLDKKLKRKFIFNKSPWLGVKCHYQYNFPQETVGLYTFRGGYCGISATENGVVNCCYLATYSSFKTIGTIEKFQKKVLSENPSLQKFFSEATPLFKEPLVISQISFERKRPVEQHIFMLGDSAGLIHPLCGNGMAMAITSAKIFSEQYIQLNKQGKLTHKKLERNYTRAWNKNFRARMLVGSMIQKLFLNEFVLNKVIHIGKIVPSIATAIVRKTHGKLLQI